MSISIPVKLKLMRESELLTQRQMAEITGIPYGTFFQYEHGRSKPGMDALVKIFKHPRFRKYRDWFLFDEVNLREGQEIPALVKAWELEHLTNDSDKTA